MESKTIHVSTGREYNIIIGNGLLKETGTLIKNAVKTCRAAVITDSNVAPLYLGTAAGSLEQAGFGVKTYVFPAGETSKNHKTLIGIYEFLARNGFTRSDVIVALGGGVTGDISGFAAATFMRGMNFVQIPTTLLAQIDASVGGKTAVDLNEGKNLVGAFWQPSLVICDPSLLKTLDSRVFSDGMAEAIKHTLIKDRSLFFDLAGGIPIDAEFIRRNIEIKKNVVEHDEREKGERMILNFGHTIGHAIEKIYNFSRYTHGEAVAAGMVMITRYAEKNGLTKEGTADKIASLLKKYSLPSECGAPLSEIVKAAGNDKKHIGNDITLVLLHDIGDCYLYRIPDADFPRFFAKETK